MKVLTSFCLLLTGTFSLVQAQNEEWVSVQEMRDSFFVKINAPSFPDVRKPADTARPAHDATGSAICPFGSPGSGTGAPALAQGVENHSLNGTFDVLQRPRYYMGNRVSELRQLEFFVDGTEMGSMRKNVKKPASPCEMTGSLLSGASIGSRGELMQIATLGRDTGEWWPYVWKSVQGLEEMVNDGWRRCGLWKKIWGFRAYSLLLYVDRNGKSGLEVLLPEQPDEDDRQTIKALQKIVDGLPTWGMGYLWRDDGKVFPGRYLKFLLTEYSHWQISDYMEQRAQVQ